MTNSLHPLRMAVAQDLPPKGGYPEPVQWKRNLPARGFHPRVYFFGVLGICTYGFYKLIAGIRERNELFRENQWSRIYIQPLLLAEVDRDDYRRLMSLQAREAAIMSEVPDFDPKKSVYHDSSYHQPRITAFPKF